MYKLVVHAKASMVKMHLTAKALVVKTRHFDAYMQKKVY